MILATTPAPTVRPPSRIAKRSPSSIAIGAISATFIFTLSPGITISVVITAYSDRSFTFITKTPPATILIKKAAGIESGSKRPNTEKVGKVLTRRQLEEIATTKMPDLTAAGMDAAVRTIAGSARSMGVRTEG